MLPHKLMSTMYHNYYKTRMAFQGEVTVSMLDQYQLSKVDKQKYCVPEDVLKW